MLNLESVSSGYYGIKVLRDISLEAKKGEFLGIIGPNGSGKTTMLKTATGVLRPFAGRVLIKGVDIAALRPRDIARVTALVPQDIRFFFPFRVIDLVMMGRTPHIRNPLGMYSARDREIAARSLDAVDASGLKERFIDELSGGERQRVIIAKALAQEPEILFLDEPTIHLDIAHQQEIFSLLQLLNREQSLTIVAVLHDLNLASEYCDRLLLLHDGRVRKSGTPHDVLDYAILEEVYRACMIVKDSPLTGRPHVFVVPSTINSKT